MNLLTMTCGIPSHELMHKPSHQRATHLEIMPTDPQRIHKDGRAVHQREQVVGCSQLRQRHRDPFVAAQQRRAHCQLLWIRPTRPGDS